MAQGGERRHERPRIDMHRGCLDGTRVTVRIVPPAGTMLSPVHVRAGGREVVHLTGVTQEASVTVRLAAPRPRERQRRDDRRRALLDRARLPPLLHRRPDAERTGRRRR